MNNHRGGYYRKCAAYLVLIAPTVIPMLLPSHSAEALEVREAELLQPSVADVSTRLTLGVGAAVLGEADGTGLRLPGKASAQWKPAQPVSIDAGTLSMWVRPLWPASDEESHVLATFKWSGADQSYFALSQGWWEPQGRKKLYVVLSNQQYVFCFMPWKFDYTLYLPNQWTMIAASWQAGNPGEIRLFVDGKRICERKIAFEGGRHAVSPVYLGSDAGAGAENLGRPANMDLRDIEISPRALTDEDIHSAYIRSGGVDRSKWMLAIAADDPAVDVSHERRMMQDEDTSWAGSKLEIRRRIERIKMAGFNVYTPCVWDGAHSFYATRTAPIAASVKDPADPEYDPLAYMISVAHAAGIAVHPWFVIARRAPGAELPPSFTDGAPQDAFNVQSKDFRDFIVAVVLDAVQRYDIDGINLDYVRALGPCSNKRCLDGYARKYRRSLPNDWTSQEQGTIVPSLIEWNRLAMTDIVQRISAGTRALKPHTVITIDTVPFDQGRQNQGVDEARWLRLGLIDAMVDMAYDDPIDIDTLDRAMQTFSVAHQWVAVRDYDWFGAAAIDRSGAAMSDYIRLIRTRWPGAGIAFYHYPHLNTDQVLSLGQGVFAPAPSPAWTR